MIWLGAPDSPASPPPRPGTLVDPPYRVPRGFVFRGVGGAGPRTPICLLTRGPRRPPPPHSTSLHAVSPCPPAQGESAQPEYPGSLCPAVGGGDIVPYVGTLGTSERAARVTRSYRPRAPPCGGPGHIPCASVDLHRYSPVLAVQRIPGATLDGTGSYCRGLEAPRIDMRLPSPPRGRRRHTAYATHGPISPGGHLVRSARGPTPRLRTGPTPYPTPPRPQGREGRSHDPPRFPRTPSRMVLVCPTPGVGRDGTSCQRVDRRPVV